VRDNLNAIPATQERLGNMGRTKLFELIRSGELKSVTIGRRRFVADSEIDRFIASKVERPAS
jgi:uncharacterized protein (UPF0261 family)